MGWEVALFYAVILIATVALAFLMRPKGPPPPAPATLDDVQVPVAEEGKEIPVIFGTVDLEAPNIVWYGNFTSMPIKKKAGK